MGYIGEQPPTIQIAEAQELVNHWLEPVRLAELKLISRNVKLRGTIGQQEAFKLTYSEIRGIAQRALAPGVTAKDVEQAKARLNRELDERILDNDAFTPFLYGVAGTDDPLMR